VSKDNIHQAAFSQQTSTIKLTENLRNWGHVFLLAKEARPRSRTFWQSMPIMKTADGQPACVRRYMRSGGDELVSVRVAVRQQRVLRSRGARYRTRPIRVSPSILRPICAPLNRSRQCCCHPLPEGFTPRLLQHFLAPWMELSRQRCCKCNVGIRTSATEDGWIGEHTRVQGAIWRQKYGLHLGRWDIHSQARSKTEKHACWC